VPRRIIIIGANAAGSSAASSARKTDREAEITLIESDKYPAYSRCGLPYVLAGQIENFEDLIVFPPQWYKMMNLDLRLETNATAIEPKEQTVQIEMMVEIPRIRVGKRQTIETLINEEALLFAKYLRDERETWIPRIAIEV
jgi:NADPH-dependent 2,4-dienoyl-CoA reductase/sulfur reductase-like enzyme